MVNDNTKRKIFAFINGAGPGIAWALFDRLTGSEEAEIDRELAEKYGEIAERMQKEKGERPQETSALDTIERRVINHLERYQDSQKKVELKKALTLAGETGCPVCTKYIQAAIDAAEEGEMEEALEWVGGVRRGLRITQKG